MSKAFNPQPHPVGAQGCRRPQPHRASATADDRGHGPCLQRAAGGRSCLVLLLGAWELDPENVDAAINLAAHILQGRHRQAVPVPGARLQELAPDDPMVWINLAAAHLGKLPFATRPMQDAAISAFEKALASMAVRRTNYNLGLIYLDRNELSRPRCTSTARSRMIPTTAMPRPGWRSPPRRRAAPKRRRQQTERDTGWPQGRTGVKNHRASG